jgi:hypothetical protein
MVLVVLQEAYCMANEDVTIANILAQRPQPVGEPLPRVYTGSVHETRTELYARREDGKRIRVGWLVPTTEPPEYPPRRHAYSATELESIMRGINDGMSLNDAARLAGITEATEAVWTKVRNTIRDCPAIRDQCGLSVDQIWAAIVYETWDNAPVICAGSFWETATGLYAIDFRTGNSVQCAQLIDRKITTSAYWTRRKRMTESDQSPQIIKGSLHETETALFGVSVEGAIVCLAQFVTRASQLVKPPRRRHRKTITPGNNATAQQAVMADAAAVVAEGHDK